MIDQYFITIESAVEKCSLITSKTITLSKYSENIGYIKGMLIFWDGTELHFREYIDLESIPSKLDYTYHCKRGNNLLFRYDNTPHHPTVPSFPHHKHIGPDEQNVSASEEPTLDSIIKEILNHLPST